MNRIVLVSLKSPDVAAHAGSGAGHWASVPHPTLTVAHFLEPQEPTSETRAIGECVQVLLHVDTSLEETVRSVREVVIAGGFRRGTSRAILINEILPFSCSYASVRSILWNVERVDNFRRRAGTPCRSVLTFPDMTAEAIIGVPLVPVVLAEISANVTIKRGAVALSRDGRVGR